MALKGAERDLGPDGVIILYPPTGSTDRSDVVAHRLPQPRQQRSDFSPAVCGKRAGSRLWIPAPEGSRTCDECWPEN
jgi:hypothetical protein